MYLSLLAKNWWVLALRGVLAIVFGVLAFLYPGPTLVTLVIFMGAFFFVDGIFALMAAIMGRADRQTWWSLILVGILGLAVGAIAFANPILTLYVIVIWIGAGAIVRGVFEIIAAIQLRREIEGEWFLALAGLISIAFGVLLFVRPLEGLVAILYIIAAMAIALGVIQLLLAFKLKGLQHKVAASSP